MRFNSLITSIVLSVCCFFSLNTLAGQFEIKPIVEDHLPGMWQPAAGLFIALQPYAVHEGQGLFIQGAGVVHLSALKDVAARIISQPDISLYINKKMPEVKDKVEAIIVVYMKKVIHANQGSVIGEESPVVEMSDVKNANDEYSHLSEQEKYLVELLWNPDLDRTPLARIYRKKFNIGSLNTVYGHISLVYQKVPGLKEFRASLKRK